VERFHDARVWKGWTTKENADAYERLRSDVVYPGLPKLVGYCGGYILRKELAAKTGFVTVNLFDSLESVKRFAGSDYETAVCLSQKRGCCCPKWNHWRIIMK
jgi:hypothetical protein